MQRKFELKTEISMIKKLLCTFACALGTLQGLECASDCGGFNSSLWVDAGVGYRHDNLKWKMHGLSPGVHIKEKWKDINMTVAEANLRYVACDHFVIKADFDYAWAGHQKKHIVSSSDDDSNVHFRRRFETKGRAYDISGGVGYKFNMDCQCYQFSFTPMVGYSYHHQRYRAPAFYANNIHGDFRLRTFPSKYSWYGPWIGVGTVTQVQCNWWFYVNGGFHFAKNQAKIQEFAQHQKSTRHARGVEATVGTTYGFCDNVFLGLKFNYKSFWAQKRHNHVKDVAWNSYFITADLGIVF